MRTGYDLDWEVEYLGEGDIYTIEELLILEDKGWTVDWCDLFS